MKSAVRTYNIQFGFVMAAYIVILFGSVHILSNYEFGSFLRAVIALLPVIPTLFGLKVIFIFYNAIDEFQKRIISEAMIASALITGFASFSYGFLEGALELPAIPMIWVLPVMIGLYGIFTAILKWRYR